MEIMALRNNGSANEQSNGHAVYFLPMPALSYAMMSRSRHFDATLLRRALCYICRFV